MNFSQSSWQFNSSHIYTPKYATAIYAHAQPFFITVFFFFNRSILTDPTLPGWTLMVLSPQGFQHTFFFTSSLSSWKSNPYWIYSEVIERMISLNLFHLLN
jgi:hypothetical protein